MLVDVALTAAQLVVRRVKKTTVIKPQRTDWTVHRDLTVLVCDVMNSKLANEGAGMQIQKLITTSV